MPVGLLGTLEVVGDEESMRHWTAEMERADALLLGRVTYEMMESAWRRPTTGTWPDWMEEWEIPFAEAIDRAGKHVVSSTLGEVDWNAELVRGDLAHAGWVGHSRHWRYPELSGRYRSDRRDVLMGVLTAGQKPQRGQTANTPSVWSAW